MKKIHITETQLAEIAKSKLNEDTTNSTTQPTSAEQGGENGVKTRNDGSSVETNNGITTYRLSQDQYDQNKNSQTNLNNAARQLSSDLGVPFQQNGRSFVTGPSTDSNGNQKLDLSVGGSNPEASARKELSGAGVSIPMDNVNTMTNTKPLTSENFFTKKDIAEARRQRLMRESVPYTKAELFGVVAESGKMYSFRFNDGETYKVPGAEVEKFKEYVFEQDGSREGKDYIIEKIG